MVVHFEPAALCGIPKEFILAPLPTRKEFWEACDADSWMQESAKHEIDEAYLGLSTKGQLLKLNVPATWMRQPERPSLPRDPSQLLSESVDWGKWCSEMDGIGGLVMLAAVLH